MSIETNNLFVQSSGFGRRFPSASQESRKRHRHQQYQLLNIIYLLS
jgi:hypothetical protein